MLMALYMLALGLSNYVGMHDRSFQQRYFWPLYLAIFFGLTLYTAVNYLSKLLRTRRSFLISLVVSIILIIVMVGAEVEPVQSPGLIHPLLWEGFLWVRENTQQDDRILFAYGDGLDQKPVLLMGQRRSWFIEQESLISTMQQGILSPSFIIGEVANTDGSNPYRTSLLTFDTHYKPGLTKKIGERSVCDFDYIVIPRVSRQEAFAIYNNLMRNHLLLSSDRQETFSNQYLSIIRNDAPGGQCYEETKLA